MSGAGFLVGVNLLVAGFIAGAFLFLSAYHRSPSAARWMAAGYAGAMAYFASEFFLAATHETIFGFVLNFATFMLALVAMNIALARHYQIVVPIRTISILCALSLIGVFVIADMPRGSMPRQVLYQLPYAALSAIAAWTVLQGARRSRSRLDATLATVVVLLGLHFASKPFLAAMLGTGANASEFLGTVYALVSQSLGAVFSVGIAVVMFAIIVRDIIAVMETRSDTDAMSGLLNRRGFEEKARTWLSGAADARLTATLVLCDLDHFKSINDLFGHAAGDRAIVVFADCLRRRVPDGGIAGRIGGEEFAVLLPMTPLAGGRLLAEAVRSAMAQEAIGGAPPELRVTASFGIADLRPGERLSDIMHRADQALYLAKRAGRDRVRAAEPDVLPALERRSFRAAG